MFIRSAYNYSVDDVSLESGLDCPDESLAIQSAEEESNINTIVRRFGLTGELPSDLRMPLSGDFVGIGDFHSAMNTVRAAQEEFLRVPADVCARFANDPAQFMAFLENPDNRDEARKMGLLRAVAESSAPSGNPEGAAAAG